MNQTETLFQIVSQVWLHDNDNLQISANDDLGEGNISSRFTMMHKYPTLILRRLRVGPRSNIAITFGMDKKLCCRREAVRFFMSLQ